MIPTEYFEYLRYIAGIERTIKRLEPGEYVVVECLTGWFAGTVVDTFETENGYIVLVDPVEPAGDGQHTITLDYRRIPPRPEAGFGEKTLGRVVEITNS